MMRPIYDFEGFTPPRLSEAELRALLEQRRQKRLALTLTLLCALLIAAAFLCAAYFSPVDPALALSLAGYGCMTMGLSAAALLLLRSDAGARLKKEG